MEEIEFYPMTERPALDESDVSFSKTVIIFGEKFNIVTLGYFDFEINEWSQFSDSNFLLMCWCYIPEPSNVYLNTNWSPIAPKAYKKKSYSRLF